MLKVTDLPDNFITAMKALLGDDFKAYADCLSKEHNRGVRINTGKAVNPGIMEKLGILSENRVPWTKNGYYYEGEARLSVHPYYAAGLFYLQEPSAMAPASLLPVEKTDSVLDLCAAPGGKSTELSNRAGFLHSNDISATRAQALLKNLELFGAANVVVTAEDPVKLKKHFREKYDKILVDAPCSGEGMFRKDASLIQAYKERGPEQYHELQVSILDSAYTMLKNGGLMLYSTCTFSETEDEMVIDEILRLHPDMELVSFDEFPQNKEYALVLDSVRNSREGFEKTLKFFPHRVKGEGHFLALMKKGVCKNTSENDTLIADGSKKDVFFEKNNMLYRLMEGVKIVPGIRYIRTGLYMGEYKDNRKTKDRILVPSQAMAMALSTEEYPSVLDLPIEDERVVRYLKGETLLLTQDEGGRLRNAGEKYVLVAVDGFSLGFASLAGDRLKNLYPRGWVRS